MLTRRAILGCGATSLAAPYFFTRTIVYADELTDGLVKDVTVLADNLGLSPAGQAAGSDVAVSGGGTVFGRALRDQADSMLAEGSFSETVSDTPQVGELCSDGVGYMFTRWQTSLHNCCIPLGYVEDQDGPLYGGAMTLFEGPNAVALRVLTSLLKERNLSTSEIMGFCWPISPSIVVKRERARIVFTEVLQITNEKSETVYADRDVLHAREGECTLRYTHTNGVPDGGGEGAIIVNRQEQFRFAFKFDPSIYR